jgi:hypothetical protein
MTIDMGEYFTAISYHVWWPSANDPYWIYNSSEIQTRVNYYGVVGVPDCRFDGVINGGSYYESWPGIVDNRSQLTSVLQLSINGYFDQALRQGQITISIYAEETPGLSNLRLRIALTESDLVFASMTWNHVFRDMIPGTSGEPINISHGQSQEFSYEFNVPEPLIPANCQLVAFVQSDQNREILQSTRESVTAIPPQTSVESEIASPTEFVLGQNYPNPFNATTRIEFRTDGGQVNLAVYDVTGSLVKTLVDASLEAGSHSVVWDGRDIKGSDVSSGVYFYRLKNAGGNEVLRMTLLK